MPLTLEPLMPCIRRIRTRAFAPDAAHKAPEDVPAWGPEQIAVKKCKTTPASRLHGPYGWLRPALLGPFAVFSQGRWLRIIADEFNGAERRHRVNRLLYATLAMISSSEDIN